MNRMKPRLNKFYFKDTSFAQLMQKRIFSVLLIARKYDAFMLEDDGRIEELIFFEYTSLNLRYPPRITQVVTEEEAMNELSTHRYDLIIAMPSVESTEVFNTATRIKEKYQDIPIIVLTPFSREISMRLAKADLGAIDYVFSWLGNAELLLAIIKLMEDRMNVEHDALAVGAQVILLVENSIYFYSSVLPQLYKFILKQSQIFSKEALNEHEMMLRMRGRPKILMARNYEEAMYLYEKYKNQMLGIISDVRFRVNGVTDSEAGIKFCSHVRSEDPFIPIILQSSEQNNRFKALNLQADFLDKNSKKFTVDLKQIILTTFGFGDFLLQDPSSGEVLMRLTNLKEFQNNILNFPEDSFRYHASRNHFSRWLYSRAMFPLAEFVKRHRISHYPNFQDAKQAIFDAIVDYRRMKNRGVVAVFEKDRYDRYSNFARIGEGSLGGKGRGLAFIDSIIKSHPDLEDYEGTTVTIPKTVVLCSDYFDDFMESNNLYGLALSNISDQEVLDAFLEAELPDALRDDFLTFMAATESPIAVRSSSLLEDSHYQPFAGVYSTYMVPNLEDKEATVKLLAGAIKSVYASVFYQESKAYMLATSNLIDQEKMSIILQEVVGNKYHDRYYPTLSGVARSLNFYPINDEKATDGIANIAFGLGKYIVDGGVSLRFSPKHPHNILQLSDLDLALKETQTRFYALSLHNIASRFEVEDSFNLVKPLVRDAVGDGSLRDVVSTYNFNDHMLIDGLHEGGRKVVTFANILQHNVYPLAKVLEEVLRVGEEEMATPVEIEFAVELNNPDYPEGLFYWLQIRPIVDSNKGAEEVNELTTIDSFDKESCVLMSKNSLGHGIIPDVTDIVYVKSQGFRSSNNTRIVEQIDALNREFVQTGQNYILVGPGRWGSSDSALGIPVKWSHIAGARIIVECGLENYRIEPSQGTHFFQNMTSFGVGYFTINPYMNDGFFNEEYLNAQEAVYESDFIRHVRMPQPMRIILNGKKGLGVVLKSEEE
ncbi:MAG: PEP/pyruvate-binding domain-containing protein [Bacteroidales bacterium]